MRNALFFIAALWFLQASSQQPIPPKESDTTTVSEKKPSPFNTGFYSIGFFDVDLRYLIKYNNYEGIRLGFGGVTNDRLFSNYKIGGYVARGFKDEDYKYSLGGSALLSEEKNTWFNFYYINDIQELGSYNYLTDSRIYSVFEPRLVNITQFYKHRTWKANLQFEVDPKVLSEVQITRTKVDQIEDYTFVSNGESYDNYNISEATLSFRISPKTNLITLEDGRMEYFDGFPKISAQFTQGLKGVGKSDFGYTKLGLKLDYNIKRTNLSSTNFLLEGAMAFGDVPLTHLFHAYPNSPTKDEILQRFSVAGRRSFETMYFGEFFSDKLATLQVKHSLRRFNISEKFRPELVFLTRHAVGGLQNIDNHQGIAFNTLDQIYSETGFELNKLIFGFGLSFAYRYGFYHLADLEDNISFKFTFYLKL